MFWPNLIIDIHLKAIDILHEIWSISSSLMVWTPGGCFTNVSQAPQNILVKIHNTRNHIHGENFNLKIYMCAQSKALGTRSKFPLEILITSTICAIHKFRKNFWRARETLVKQPPGSMAPPMAARGPTYWMVVSPISGRLFVVVIQPE